MKTLLLTFLSLFIFGSLISCQPANIPLNTKNDSSQWVKENFAKNKIPPFSFVYAGRNSNTIISKWDYEAVPTESADSHVNHIFSYNKNGTFIIHHAKGCTSERNDFRPYADESYLGHDHERRY